MRKGRFTEEQMVAILRAADRTSVAEAAKKNKVSEPKIYAWRKHFGQMDAVDVKRLRALEAENARLKKRLAEAALGIEVLKEINAKNGEPAGSSRPARSRQSAWPVATASVRAARHLAFGAELRASIAGQGRARLRGHEDVVGAIPALRLSTHPHLSSAAGPRAVLVANASALAPSGTVAAQEAPQAPHRHRQAKDACPLQGQCGLGLRLRLRHDGRNIKCLTVIDEYTRECLAIDVAGSIRSKRVIEVLARLVSVHGPPLFLRSDNGPEFVSHAILEWIAQSGIATALSDPGKPWQNGADESFNGKLRDECLSLEWLRSRREAAIVIESWRQHCNAVRPHSSLNYLTPHEFKQQHSPIPTGAVL